jgi:hypothetical protein
VPPRGTCLDLVVHGASPSLPRALPLGEAVQAHASLTAVDPGVAELGLLGYPSASSPPIIGR